MKYLILSFPRSCNQAKPGVEFRNLARNASRVRRKVRDGNALMAIKTLLTLQGSHVPLSVPALCGKSEAEKKFFAYLLIHINYCVYNWHFRRCEGVQSTCNIYCCSCTSKMFLNGFLLWINYHHLLIWLYYVLLLKLRHCYLLFNAFIKSL